MSVIDDDARMRSATELKIVLAAEAFNLLKHPEISSYRATRKALFKLGANAIFEDPAADFANNVGRMFSTVVTAR